MGIGIHGSAGGGTPTDPIEVNIIEYGSVATSLGQKIMAASEPVVIASNQSAIPTTIAGNTSASGIIDANGEAVSIAVPSGGGSIGIQITGTWTGQIDFQATISGDPNWVSVNTSNGVNTINATAFNGIFVTAGGGFVTIRAVATTWSLGSATVTMVGSVGTGPVLLSAPLPQGTNTLGAVNDVFSSRSDTFAAPGDGTTVSAVLNPFKAYSIQVVGQGAPASLWDVRLEGSLDSTNFDQILQHTNAIGDTKIVFSGALLAPSLYFRSRCASLTLGTATGVAVTIAGIQ